MKVTLEATSKVVTLNGVPARIWEGQTEKGIPVHAFVTRIAVARDQDSSEFERDLQETRTPSVEVNAAYPARMVL